MTTCTNEEHITLQTEHCGCWDVDFTVRDVILLLNYEAEPKISKLCLLGHKFL